MKSLAHLTLLATLLATPLIASAAVSVGVGVVVGGGFGGSSCLGYGISCIGSMIVYIINSILVPVLFAVAFIVFLYGVAKSYIFSHGDSEGVAQGHKFILWGLIGFVVMVSLWGMVNVVSNTFGLWGVGSPQLPVSYPTY